MKYRSLFFLLFILTGNLLAQSGSHITITKPKGHTETFAMRGKPRIEIVNNRLNIAVIGQNGHLIQLNGLQFKYLKTPSKALQNAKLLYMDPANAGSSMVDIRPWKKNITISCKQCKVGDPIVISGKENIKINGQMCLINFRFEGIIPTPTHIQTEHQRNK